MTSQNCSILVLYSFRHYLLANPNEMVVNDMLAACLLAACDQKRAGSANAKIDFWCFILYKASKLQEIEKRFYEGSYVFFDIFTHFSQFSHFTHGPVSHLPFFPFFPFFPFVVPTTTATTTARNNRVHEP